MKSNPIIDDYGTKIWCNKKGQWHRLDGPAIVYKDGEKWWYLHGVRHRDDGPAIIGEDGEEEWWINDKQVKPIPKHIILWRKKLNEK